MKFLQDCWIALLELLNLATFSTTGGPSLQQALQQPDHQFPLPDHASKPPIFQPPSGPEDPRSTFECDYSAMGNQWVPCSTPEDRKCWLAGPAGDRFDINTDYERRYPNGTTRKYSLVLDEDSTLNADGLVMPFAKLFNKQYPGPWIEACWGDIIEVTVENQLAYNGTSIHWHGVRQLESLEMDGVNAVTQCPIAPGDKFTYRFRAMQYGTTWYHSHYSLQYGDGLVGPLTIHGPSATEYDDVRDPILMTDWNHRSGFMDFHNELAGPPPLMDSILLNGNGSYAGGGNGGHKYNTTFEKGKKYLLRLINTSVDTTFVFAIDNHNITVMSSDFVPIHPYTTSSVLVGIGQRYHVVVTASPKEISLGGTWGNDFTANGFWIRTIPAINCSGFPAGGAPDERQGIVFYGEDKKLLPTTQRNPGISLTCSDEPYEKLVPIIPWTIGKASNAHNPTTTGQFGDKFGVGLQTPVPGQGRPLPTDGFTHWAIGDRPLHLNFNDPTILNLDNKTFDPEYVVIPEDYPDGWVYLLITAIPLPQTSGRRVVLAASHPIHLHGHDFALLAQSKQNLTANPPKLKLDNPPRRDVTLLPAGGYIIIAFKPDNPGVWLMHCHIAWHASSGLALQILERQETARRQLTPARLKETKRVCDNWNTWFANESNHWPGPEEPRVATFQEDSGI